MPLTKGAHLGSYQIVEPLGAGGMGEVYRARDTRLGRDVAIKVLPDAFARDPERLARFEREAQVLASLNHPNIAAIHGLEDHDGIRFLVMEYVPGETLSGPLPVEEAMPLARQIAEALEAAHEKGIVHRDLKPANIKVTPEGKVKVLDFGLAKAFAEEASSADLSHSPTMTAAATRAGVILGTAAYMSPEQARGKPVDKRTDIWAFGCVLYEMLTGRQAYGGETVSDAISTVLTREPEWTALPPGSPVTLLRLCLQKDPKLRLRDIGDAFHIQEAPVIPQSAIRNPVAAATPWVVAAVSILALVIFWDLSIRSKPPLPVRRLTVALSPAERLVFGRQPSMAISPDGTRIAYVASRGGPSQLYWRAMDRFESTPISGTEGAEAPFFSPDGQWVGFFAEDKLKKVSLNFGSPLALADAPNARGGSWAADDTIIFSPTTNSGLLRIQAGGGAAKTVTEKKRGEVNHRWPEILPGGKAVLFTVWAGTGGNKADIEVQSLETGERRLLVQGATYGRYESTGHLVYAQAGGLLAVPFDVSRLQITGQPFPILDSLSMVTATGGAQFSLSRDGTLVYLSAKAGQSERKLLWVDRKGAATPIPAPEREYTQPRLSPDGRRVAVGIEAGTNPGVWLYDLERESLRLVTPAAAAPQPAWTPDGRRIAFRSVNSGAVNISWISADASGAPEVLTRSESVQWAASFSPNGRLLAFTLLNPTSGWDMWMLPMDGERKPQPFLQTPHMEGGGMFSPDGRWVAYTSNESGREEVYVQPFPGPGSKWLISTEGGGQPVWARNGREIFYRNGDKMMSVPVTTQPEFHAAKPVQLFEGYYENSLWGFTPDYDVAPDGRFLMIKASGDSAPTQLSLVQNWFEEFKRRASPGK